ncbi:MAG: hypothetical protein AABW51_01820 [Nanoarchaeota archaeon]
MAVKEFIKELNGKRVEGEIVKTIFISLITSFVLLALIYYLKFRFIENFIPKYGFYLFFAVLSYALILPTVRQVQAYKYFGCMSGMMIGMTIGMIAGFLAGFFVGATNGMFWGSIFGIAVGMALGIWNGLCCGVMGFMEGGMAGFMGGLMGAMTAVMMLNDNLKYASIVIFTVCGVILVGLSYMIYGETKEKDREHFADHFSTMVISFILTIATAWLMVFGPRSLLFG